MYVDMMYVLYNKTRKMIKFIPGSKEKLGQRRSYIASVVGMTLATNVGSTFILWKSSLPCIPTLGWRQNPRSFRPLDVGPTS